MPTRPPGSPTLDLTLAGSFGSINDLVFEMPPIQRCDDSRFYTFLQIGPDGTEQGINTDGALQFGDKGGHRSNQSVRLARVPIVIGDGTNGTVDGVAYRQFLLNINEPDSVTGSFLSLDRLQIWQEESGSLTGFTPGAGFAGSHTNHLVYDVDAGADRWVGLRDVPVRHEDDGSTTIAMLVPDSAFISDGIGR